MNKATSTGVALIGFVLFLTNLSAFFINDIGATPISEFVWTGESIGHMVTALATALGVAVGARGFAVAHKREVTGMHSRDTLVGKKK